MYFPVANNMTVVFDCLCMCVRMGVFVPEYLCTHIHG